MSQIIALPNSAAVLRAKTKRIARRLFDRSAEVWRATVHRRITRRPGNGERLFCAQPFERFEVLGGGGDRGETYFCCQNWVTRSIGNMGETSVEKVWNGRAAQEFRRSILDGSFRYCRTELCPYLQRVDGPVQRVEDVEDEDLLEVIRKELTVMPFGPKDVICCFDQSCNLSCPTCRDQLIMETAHGNAIVGIQKRLEDEALKDARLLYITGSGDPFGSPFFRRWLRTMKRSSMPKLERLHLHTNALLWTPRIWASIPVETRALVRSATISIDAARPDTYAENRRGGDFETLLERLAFIGSLRRNGPLEYLEIHMTVQLNNFEQMPEFVELGRRHGCDRVTFHQMVDWDTFSPEEFAARAIHQPQHPRHGAFLAMLHDPALKQPIVNLSNLTELATRAAPQPTLAGEPGEHTADGPTEKPENSARRIRWGLPLGMRDLIRDLRDGRALFAMAREHLWFLPLMAVLAILSAAFEGVGLTLVIPLVESLREPGAQVASHGYLGFLNRFVGSFAPGIRTEAVLALIIGAVVAKSVFSYANAALLGVVYGRLSHRLRTTLFERVLSLPLSKVEQEKSGRLLNTLNNETWRATDAVNLVFVVITSLATALVFVTLLALLSWQLALIAIVCLSLIPPVVQLVSQRAKRLSTLANEANEALAQQTWSALNGLRTIHAFGRAAYEQKRFATASGRVSALFLKMALVVMTTGPITEIMIVGVLALLVLLVSSGPTSLGTLAAFIALLYRLQPRLLALASAQSSLSSLHGSITAVNALLKFEPSAGPPSSAPVYEGPVSFRQVTFRYPASVTAAVRNLTFELPTAGLVAIVGVSGAGKSTLLDLLLRFQTPQAGEIRIGDQLLTETAAPAWRSHVGVVSQDPYVFDDTVRANVLYGWPEAAEAEMIGAAKAVAAHDFIEALPRGYDTRVGERAVQLSGGERQRIALARALLRSPALLVLDEATNALDAATEAICQDTLKAFAREKAVIVVAHRYSTIACADHVIVLQDGSIVEQGAPAELRRAGGPFARMFALSLAEPDESLAAVGSDAG